MVIADLHIHSRYAMACSENITIRSIAETAVTKGIDIVGTGDILHKDWLDEARKELTASSDGIFHTSYNETLFIPSSEISTVFSDSGKTRKVHHCILLPNLESADLLRDRLSKYGNLDSDGRPTLMMDAPHFVEELFSVEPNAFIFPAHIWTPYFGALGSMSGYDSVRDTYKDQYYRIKAIETGLSSDPPMNWLVSGLDDYALLSNSDMHSLMNMGREANVFDIQKDKISYKTLINGISSKEGKRLSRTIEFFPEEGKYHYDGHRECKVSVDPMNEISSICRVCGKPLVKGVLHRVKELSDRELGYVPKGAVPYTHIVPLRDLIASVLSKGKYTKSVMLEYETLTKRFGSEFSVLIDADINEISGISGDRVAAAVESVRNGKVHIVPGYAGVFGEVSFEEMAANPTSKTTGQKSLLS